MCDNENIYSEKKDSSVASMALCLKERKLTGHASGMCWHWKKMKMAS